MTIAIVEGGATSCASPIATGDVTLDPGKLSTVAVFSRPGDGGAPALEVAAFTDDRTTAGDTIRVRVIHAALGTSYAQPEGALAARASAAKTTVLTDRVEPRRAATESEAVQVDALGYVTAPPIPPPASIAIGAALTDGGADAGFEPWLSKADDLGLSGGSLHGIHPPARDVHRRGRRRGRPAQGRLPRPLVRRHHDGRRPHHLRVGSLTTLNASSSVHLSRVRAGRVVVDLVGEELASRARGAAALPRDAPEGMMVHWRGTFGTCEHVPESPRRTYRPPCRSRRCTTWSADRSSRAPGTILRAAHHPDARARQLRAGDGHAADADGRGGRRGRRSRSDPSASMRL